MFPGISTFLEEIFSLSHSIVFLYFFALIAEEGFLNLADFIFSLMCSSNFSSPLTKGFIRFRLSLIILTKISYNWASLVAQLVKNPPAMQETWVRSLGWEDALEKGKATHSNILA